MTLAFLYSIVEEEVNGMQDTPPWFNILPQLFDTDIAVQHEVPLANMGPLQPFD